MNSLIYNHDTMVSALTLVLILASNASNSFDQKQTVKVGSIDESSVIGSEISLYYFPDALKVIRTLRPGESIQELTESKQPVSNPGNSGVSSADQPKPTPPAGTDKATEEPKSLEEALANHSRVLNSLALDNEELNGVKEKLPSLESELEELESLGDDRVADVGKADKKVAQLEAAIEAEMDAEKKLQLEEQLVEAKKAQSKANRALTSVKTKVESKKKEIKSWTDRMDVLQQNIATFNQRVAASNAHLLTARAKLRREAKASVEGFAKERDSEPVYYLAASSAKVGEPAKRVSFTAFKNARTLFLRGTRDDVDYVKELIAELDRPTPQARLSLWNLELDVSGNQARNALAKNLPRVSEALDTARSQTAALTSYFRSAVNQEVRRIEQLKLPSYPNNNSVHIFSELYARYNFYESEVARRLGFDDTASKLYGEYFYFTRWILPDPASTTTLGESLMIFLLGSADSRCRIWDQFVYSIQNDSSLNAESKDSAKAVVDRLRKALGHSGDKSTGLTAYQLEIVRALQLTALDRIIDKSTSLAQLLDAFQDSNPNLFKSISSNGIMGVSTPGDWHRNVFCKSVKAGGSIASQGITSSAAFMLPALLWLRSEFGVGIDYFDSLLRDWKKSAPGQDQASFEAFCRRKFRYVFPTAQSNARIAAADEMLKTIMIAFEDDIHFAFVEPALAKVRQAFKQKGVNVGTLERTTMLATNRFIGRVKTSASAQLDLAGEEKVLENAIGLANLVTANQNQNLSQILGNMNQENKFKDMELYAINSGSEYKITPIFDPSGQAFSFQFDYVKTTNISDPDGSASVLPRVDTHEINLKVQVSNLEIREISQFTSNTKLGVPNRVTGGIPILQDIPLLRELPLIGWFSKKNGREAVSQTSFIFAQSAVYPTIGDIGSLLTGSFMVPPFSSSDKAERKEKDKGKKTSKK